MEYKITFSHLWSEVPCKILPHGVKMTMRKMVDQPKNSCEDLANNLCDHSHQEQHFNTVNWNGLKSCRVPLLNKAHVLSLLVTISESEWPRSSQKIYEFKVSAKTSGAAFCFIIIHKIKVLPLWVCINFHRKTTTRKTTQGKKTMMVKTMNPDSLMTSPWRRKQNYFKT